MTTSSAPAKVGFAGAAAFVIANMIGTGVFTSLGFQLMGIHDLFAVIMLWVIGAIIALCGALVYGELGAAMPRSGGEYTYLSRIYHPSIGFLSGWVSMTIGFAAPVALSSMAFGSYAGQVLSVPTGPLFSFGPIDFTAQRCLAVGVLLLMTAVHCTGIRIGAFFQRSTTAINVILILVFIFCGIFLAKSHLPGMFMPGTATIRDMLTPGFAVSLVYVSYAYSGWNAAAYIAGDIDKAQKRIPLVLLAGTGLVAMLYIALNSVFLYTAPVTELAGNVEVGYISARHIFGATGGAIMGVLISLLLVASVSSMVFIGPRVTQVVGEDLLLFSWFSKRTAGGSPMFAILFQSAISLVLILSSTFDKVMIYVGFTLNLITFLAVLGVFIHRIRFPAAPRPYKTWGYPVTPVVFLALTSWFMIYLVKGQPKESIAGFLTVLTGLVVFWVNAALTRNRSKP